MKVGGVSQLLYLELTDGGQTIHAMEYHAAGPIISADTEPGAKVAFSTTHCLHCSH